MGWVVSVWLFCDVLRPEFQNFDEVSEKSYTPKNPVGNKAWAASSNPLLTGLNLLHETKFQRFLFFLNSKFLNSKPENFVHIEWSEEKFLNMLLKQASDDRSFANAAGEL